MIDFKHIANTGPHFVNILFDKIGDTVDNILVEVYFITDCKEKYKVKSIVCDETETSVTIYPLAKGKYEYEVIQIAGLDISKETGTFSVEDIYTTYDTKLEKRIPNSLDGLNGKDKEAEEQSLAQMKEDLERMEFVQLTSTLSREKEKALVKQISELAKQIRERENELR